MLGQGLALGLQQLSALARPLNPFQLQITVIHAGHHLASLDDVTGTDRGLGDVAVEGCNHDALYRPFQLRLGIDTEISLGNRHKQQQPRSRENARLQAKMPATG